MIVANYRPLLSWVLVFPLILGGCSSLTPEYDKAGYEQATALKGEALTLMDKSTESFAAHQTEVDTLKANLDKAHEYAQGRSENEKITEQWAVMKDPQRHLLGGFLVRWEDKNTLGADFILGVKRNVSLGFDQIIALEQGLAAKN